MVKAGAISWYCSQHAKEKHTSAARFPATYSYQQEGEGEDEEAEEEEEGEDGGVHEEINEEADAEKGIQVGEVSFEEEVMPPSIQLSKPSLSVVQKEKRTILWKAIQRESNQAQKTTHQLSLGFHSLV